MPTPDFLSETRFAQDTYRFGLLGARIASGKPVDAAVREDICYDRPNQQLFQIVETAVPAGVKVVAKGKYSAAENGLIGTISLTAVSDVTMRQLKNTKRGYIAGICRHRHTVLHCARE
ncbi:MAG TPA: hypothetical protein VII12_07975 [Thermoanaerobaculia bacterium]